MLQLPLPVGTVPQSKNTLPQINRRFEHDSLTFSLICGEHCKCFSLISSSTALISSFSSLSLTLTRHLHSGKKLRSVSLSSALCSAGSCGWYSVSRASARDSVSAEGETGQPGVGKRREAWERTLLTRERGRLPSPPAVGSYAC